MDYRETCDYLFCRTASYETQGTSGYKEGLEYSLTLDAYFAHPHRQYPTIHVAGTNGKGSVSHMLAAVLQRSGYRVGLYTSPHLVDFRERIRINGQPVSEQYVVDFVAQNRAFWEPLAPSFFEVTTALAFKYFAEQHVDIAVIETGLGGRLDCTNIISPILSIITNISLDHTQLLGHTLEAIANEKAGIIKPATPVVIGENQSETRPVFERKAKDMEAPIVFAEDDALVGQIQQNAQGGIVCATRKFGTLRCDLGGLYQRKNLNTVLHALHILEDKGILSLTPDRDGSSVLDALSHVTEETGLAGRWQTVATAPRVICDTGHNAGGWTYVSRQLQQIIAQGTRLHIVFGMVDDKDVEAVVRMLPKEAKYYFTKAQTPRALNEQALLQLAYKYQLDGQAFTSVSEAFREARHEAGNDGTVFVGGSNYIVGELLRDCV